MPAALKKLPKPTWPESSVPPGRRRASQQPPSRAPPAGAARTREKNGCSMPSVFLPALRLTALRSAGLQQGSGSQGARAGEGGGVPRTASCLGAQLRCPGHLAELGAQHGQQRRRYLYRKLRRALPTSQLGRTSAAGDGLSPVRTRRPARPGSPALPRSLRVARPLSWPPGTPAAGSRGREASILSRWRPSFRRTGTLLPLTGFQNSLLLCTRPPGTPVLPLPPSPPSRLFPLLTTQTCLPTPREHLLL